MGDPRGISVDFAGETVSALPGGILTVGRAGDLAIDDNPYLHREFLRFDHEVGMWWVANVGSRLAAYLTDEGGIMRTTLAPGARTPLVSPRTQVTFAVGETIYELLVETEGYEPAAPRADAGSKAVGEATIVPGKLTPAQLLAVLALAEPVLRRSGSGAGRIPSSAEASRRLGWTAKRFDKKIENICDKLASAGVRGLRGSSTGAASNRRLHLVEYAVSVRLVTPDLLPMLDADHAVAESDPA